MIRHWKRLFRSPHRGRRAQALVEFALVIMLIVTTMVGGVLVIQALFIQQRLIDIVARAAQWGAMTNSNDEILKILDEACAFSRDARKDMQPDGKIPRESCLAAKDVLITFTPTDPRQRPIGSRFTVEIRASIPMAGPAIALDAQMGARSVVIIEHTPMRFAIPEPPPFSFRPGDYVRVHTTAKESLNVRRNYGLRSSQYFSLYDGNYVLIVGGPVIADGLRWWQVERTLSNGQKLRGWCVDQADTVDTLILAARPVPYGPLTD